MHLARTDFIFVAMALTGCMAPHGMAPLPLPAGKGSGQVELSGGYGATSGRNIERMELGVGGQADDWFALELRGQYIRVQDNKGVNGSGAPASRTVHMFQPYARPAFFAGPVTIAIPISGFAMGGGGGGIAAGLFGMSLGVGGKSWNVFSGIQWQGSDFVSSSPYSSTARELCFGGRYALIGDYFRVSIDPQLVFSKHSFSTSSGGTNESGPTDSFSSDRSFAMGLLQISVALGDWQAKNKVLPLVAPPPIVRAPPPAPPDACRVFCERQGALDCGFEIGRCRMACDQRNIPQGCRALSDELVQCEAKGLICAEQKIHLPSCREQRQALDTCMKEKRQNSPAVSPAPCDGSQECPDDTSPLPRLIEPKSLGEVPQ